MYLSYPSWLLKEGDNLCLHNGNFVILRFIFLNKVWNIQSWNFVQKYILLFCVLTSFHNNIFVNRISVIFLLKTSFLTFLVEKRFIHSCHQTCIKKVSIFKDNGVIIDTDFIHLQCIVSENNVPKSIKSTR
jgi:hypothetical protein